MLQAVIAAARAMAVPELRDRLSGPPGIDMVGSGPQALTAFPDRRAQVWGKVVRDNGIRSE